MLSCSGDLALPIVCSIIHALLNIKISKMCDRMSVINQLQSVMSAIGGGCNGGCASCCRPCCPPPCCGGGAGAGGCGSLVTVYSQVAHIQ
ncbi:hypothetical protein evm_004843 [Chilo suppressalis]|nr:hypothetical protein evm_004843 [Chilo suppressalis]